MIIRADFHTHSIGEETFGPRAEDLVARHVDAAAEVGLDCIAVTDHNDLRPGLLACAYAARQGHRVLVIPGMELTTQERIHLVAIGLSEPIEPWQPLAETIVRIREAGGLSILPHPFYAHLRMRRDVDAIERFNAHYGDFDLNGTTCPRWPTAMHTRRMICGAARIARCSRSIPSVGEMSMTLSGRVARHPSDYGEELRRT